MIGGATRGRGGGRLARYLASAVGSDAVVPGPCRGLLSDPGDAHAQQRELDQIQAHVRTRRPIHHVHCDPPPGLPAERSTEICATYWETYEQEFGLDRMPFYSRVHVKAGRTHEHRVYGVGRPDGSVIDLRFERARREKVGRLTEARHGLPWTKGGHNRAVITALERQGQPEVAAAMRAAGLDMGPRPLAALSPAHRAQQERTGVSRSRIAAQAFAAWRSADTDTGAAFVAALRAAGLDLRHGNRALVIVDPSGNVHRAAQLMTEGARAAGSEPIRAASLRAHVGGLDLVRHVPGEQPPCPSIPAPTPCPTPVPPAQLPPGMIHRAIILCPRPTEAHEEAADRRLRWKAILARGEHDLRWMPPTVAARVKHVRVRPEQAAVLVTLRSGTSIMTCQTRIDIVGEVGDVTAREIVNIVRRRGWRAVELRGDGDFRQRVTWGLHLLDPPIAVLDDPLTEADWQRIEAIRHTRSDEATTEPDGASTPSGMSGI